MKINRKQGLLARIARRGFLLVSLLAMMLICATAGRAQSSATTAPAQDTKAGAAAPAPAPVVFARPASAQANSPESTEEKHPVKGTHEGIVVHGHWTIEVRNPDGRVASHLDFENTLNSSEGADLLTGVLSGEFIPLGFAITLLNNSNGSSIGLCGNTGVCFIEDSRNEVNCGFLAPPGTPEAAGNACGGFLKYTPNQNSTRTFNNAIGYTLSGSVTNISNGGTINEVFSGIEACLPSKAIRQTGLTNNFPFTGVVADATNSTALSPTITSGTPCLQTGGFGISNGNFPAGLSLTGTPIALPAVTAGQSISVTVVITFSGS